MPIYDFFVLNKEAETAICLTCNKVIKARKDGPSKTMVQHLKTHRRQYEYHEKLKKEWARRRMIDFKMILNDVEPSV